MMNHLKELFESFDSDALVRMHRRNLEVLEQYRRNVSGVACIVQLMEEELRERGLDGNVS